MRAIILSAGRGTRLLPKTAHTPKCLLPLCGRKTVLEHPLRRTAALACAGLLCLAGKPAFADDPVAEPEPKLELRGEFDEWLHGPSVKLSPTEGWLRPYVVGAGGVRSDVHRLGIEDPTNRFLDEPYAGRVGGGVELHLDERASLAVEGATILEPGSFVTEVTQVLGLKLRFSF